MSAAGSERLTVRVESTLSAGRCRVSLGFDVAGVLGRAGRWLDTKPTGPVQAMCQLPARVAYRDILCYRIKVLENLWRNCKRRACVQIQDVR